MALALAVPAHAAAEILYAPSALVLPVSRGATVERAVTIDCAPTPRGTHPAPEAACAEIHAADRGGDISALMETSRSTTPCTREWDPVTLDVTGVWKGHRVSLTQTYPNSCVMRSLNSTLLAF
ncbi:SSI family serine proteinase inhibitor [Streptomyces chartreusis]|uniref:SSI family serine proteinase inhibitor n=1 Tax=Streptomyces chartreusis TaxID=1969 RepID=UPI002E17E430|nr:SSI family serine proteinase inhibitor [Streptomyces chartreusis]